jgi:hypothetical protein
VVAHLAGCAPLTTGPGRSSRIDSVPMPLSAPRDSTIAVVGDGFCSLAVLATARYLGFGRDDVTIYGTNDLAVGTYQGYAFNLGQTVLRSESESHFLPADWPTFAQLDAWSRRDPSFLFRSAIRKFNPGVPDILAEATAVQEELGWNDARFPARVGWVQREVDPVPHFVLYDEDATFIGRAKHVLLAIGHGPLSFPPTLAKAREDRALVDRIVQAYEPKAYAAGGRYVVIGAGIASVNEWANALDSGASVLSLLRNPSPDEQDLNAPRCLFEALGIDAFQGLPLDERLAFLGKILKGTTPRRRSWIAKIEEGRSQGRFAELIGEIDTVEPGPLGLRIHVMSKYGPDPGWLDVTGVVAGTGFAKSMLTVPLYRRLAESYPLPVVEGRIQLKANCGIPMLDIPSSRLCVGGIFANTVIPHGDTIAGVKYVCRRFVGDVVRAERPPRRGPFARVGMQLRLASSAARAIRRSRRVEQLA